MANNDFIYFDEFLERLQLLHDTRLQHNRNNRKRRSKCSYLCNSNDDASCSNNPAVALNYSQRTCNSVIDTCSSSEFQSSDINTWCVQANSFLFHYFFNRRFVVFLLIPAFFQISQLSGDFKSNSSLSRNDVYFS